MISRGRGARLRLALAALVTACGIPAPLPVGDGGGPLDGGRGMRSADAATPDQSVGDAPVVPRPLVCGAAIGLSRDVLSLARLDGEQTRSRASSIREDLDGPAAVRDDDPATGWAPVPDVIATLRIDLGSGVGRPIALDALTITTSGPRLADVHVSVREACGGEVTADFAWDDVTLPLAFGGACGSCVELEVRGGLDSRVLSLSIYSRDASVELPSALPDAAPTPASESGVIEGFYGPSWSFAERARMIDAMSRLGLGTYLYAPKFDPLDLTEWREPYDATMIRRFASLASIARERGVRFLFGVSPFVDFQPGVEADYAALVAKLRTLLDAGASGVAVLADDIGGGAARIDAALGALHASVLTRLASELSALYPGVAIWFVPTVYDDAILASTPGGAAYLTALRALPADVRVLWTGQDVGNTTLAPGDLTDVRALIEREPVIWDNEWANDPNDTAGDHLLLGTYEGRDASLRAATYGIAANPLVQGSLSRLPIGLLGAWLSRGEVGDLARASAASAEERYAWRSDPTTHETLVRLMQAYDGTFTVPATHRALEAALARITTAMQAGLAPAAADLTLALDVFAGLATLRSAVRNGALDADLGDELEAPLTSLAEDGRAGLALLDQITARLGGGEGTDAESAARAHLAASRSLGRFAWSPGLLAATLDAVVAAPAIDHGMRAPAAVPLAPLSCVVGEPLVFGVFTTTGVARAYGLPGAVVTGGTVRFVPSRPGRYTAVITAAEPESGGVASAWLDVVCVPAR